jgi:peptide/nickel transport system ATP-binding protein
VFQNPDDSLNPRQTVAQILGSPVRLYFGLTGAAARERSLELLRAVRLGPQHLDRLPSQLSGGEKQRVAIARAFAAEPDLLLCDEVTSALDVSVQAAVLSLLLRLRHERAATMFFVSHDLAVVRAISDHVAVLYRGELCELGAVAEVFDPPYHPYTEALLSAVLEVDGPTTARHIILSDAASPQPQGKGCPFAGRCPRQMGTLCEEVTPAWQSGRGHHRIRCHIPLADLHSVQARAAE